LINEGCCCPINEGCRELINEDCCCPINEGCRERIKESCLAGSRRLAASGSERNLMAVRSGMARAFP
jgi:hypothetical protein